MSMRKLGLGLIMSVACIFVMQAQDQTPATEAGEDFDLNAVMTVLEDAEDLQDFEKKINNAENQVNNLDLNNDDEVDIVKVVEVDEENTRLLILRAVIGENDFQDVATIEIEKHEEDQISLQVIGDPDIYGPDYVVEPAEESGSTGKKGGGDSWDELPEVHRYFGPPVFVSVHLWRPIRPLFRVGRVIFISTVVWRPIPTWFIITRPIARATWRNRTRRYRRSRYRTATRRHSRRARNMYSNKRRNSSVARNNFGAKPGAKSGPSTGPKTGPSTKPNTKPNTAPKNQTTRPPNQQTAPKKNQPSKGKKQGKPVPRKKN